MGELRGSDHERGGKRRFQIGDTVIFDVELFAAYMLEQPRLGIAVFTLRGDRVATLHTEVQQKQDWSFSGRVAARAVWKNLPLNSGEYRIDVSWWSRDGELETITGCASIDIAAKDILYGTGRLPDPSFQGYLIPEVSWQITTVQDPDKAELHQSKDRGLSNREASLVRDTRF